MKILIKESVDKRIRTIVNIEPNMLETLLEKDLGFIEVIPMMDPNANVRIYFDIDQYDVSFDPLNDVLNEINQIFDCRSDEWAIASCLRETKRSYHIVSRTKQISIRELRRISHKLSEKYKCVDTKHLYYSILDDIECGFFRLPNQTKKGINKESPPLTIISGSISDFFITNVE
jgi:DNA-binding Lrp family transcriptional regulator